MMMMMMMMIIQLLQIYVLAERFHDIYVDVLERLKNPQPKLCGFADIDRSRIHNFYCPSPLKGSWVKIWKDKIASADDMMTFCEVKVIGVKQGTL